MTREWNNLDRQTQDTLRAHMDEVPVKLSTIARSLGVSIKASTLPAGISGELRPDPDTAGKFIIRVNRHDSPRRQRFTVAHELGHFLLHKDQIGSGLSDDALYRSRLSDSREAEANRMAAEILMPQEKVNEWLEKAEALGVEGIENTVSYLAERFDVSEAAMKIRLGLNTR
jgi:hypothetical protein